MDAETIKARMAVAKMASDRFKENPPDHERWAEALRQCAQLFEFAASHLEGDPDYAEAIRCVDPSVQMGANLLESLQLAYALSGRAAEDMFKQIKLDLERE